EQRARVYQANLGPELVELWIQQLVLTASQRRYVAWRSKARVVTRSCIRADLGDGEPSQECIAERISIHHIDFRPRMKPKGSDRLANNDFLVAAPDVPSIRRHTVIRRLPLALDPHEMV